MSPYPLGGGGDSCLICRSISSPWKAPDLQWSFSKGLGMSEGPTETGHQLWGPGGEQSEAGSGSPPSWAVGMRWWVWSFCPPSWHRAQTSQHPGSIEEPGRQSHPASQPPHASSPSSHTPLSIPPHPCPKALTTGSIWVEPQASGSLQMGVYLLASWG